MEMEINLLNLLREYGRKWYWMLGAIAIGWAAGKIVSSSLQERYSSEVIFVSEGESDGNQGLGGLSILTGRLGIGGSSEESPFIAHFEDILRTRNFKSGVLKLIVSDSAYLPARRLFDTAALGSDRAFAGAISPFIKTRKDGGLYHIEAVSPDSLSSLFLAKALFRAFDSKVREQKRQTLEENHAFIQSLVNKNKQELDHATDALRRFLESNRFFGTPKLEQERQELTLKVKLEEEKYIITIKEFEALKIKKEKQDHSLTVIEDAYINSSPVFPDRRKISAASVFAAALLSALAIAVLFRRRWIVFREGPAKG